MDGRVDGAVPNRDMVQGAVHTRADKGCMSSRTFDKSADPEALGRQLQGSYLEAGDGTAQHGCVEDVGIIRRRKEEKGWLCQSSSVTLMFAQRGTGRVVRMP